MENQDFNQDQKSHQESSESSKVNALNKVQTTLNVQNLSSNISELQSQIIQLKESLEASLIDNKQKENEIEKLKYELSEKSRILKALETEMNQIQFESQRIIQSQKDQINGLERLLLETRNEMTRMNEDSLQLKSNLESVQNLIKEKDIQIDNQLKTIESWSKEKESYIKDIAKLHEIIQQTEKEIEEIETHHTEIQNQLRLEIKRTEDRVGQITAEVSRDSAGNLARNSHIRKYLDESEIGRIVLYIMDYFEDSKKKVLALETICDELNIPPIIARKNIRYLYELGVCDFNEITKEIKIVKATN